MAVRSQLFALDNRALCLGLDKPDAMLRYQEALRTATKYISYIGRSDGGPVHRIGRPAKG